MEKRTKRGATVVDAQQQFVAAPRLILFHCTMRTLISTISGKLEVACGRQVVDAPHRAACEAACDGERSGREEATAMKRNLKVTSQPT